MQPIAALPKRLRCAPMPRIACLFRRCSMRRPTSGGDAIGTILLPRRHEVARRIRVRRRATAQSRPMPVIAVVNRKGGSGKSTLATHLAAWCAHAGIPVMLGDVDRQQSTQSWLRLREAQGLTPAKAPLVGWAVDPKRVMRPPAGVNHVILDTPGGLH